MINYTIRPLQWVGERTPSYMLGSPFTATWSATLGTLERELDALRAKNIVLQMDVRESDIRIDGQVKANARPASQAVRLVFDSMHGPLAYQCDSMATWQQNVRAIALGLEALRKVDRYGITRRGEQYKGWKELTTGSMTRDEALTVLRRWSPPSQLHQSTADLYRSARAAAHPDRNGGDHAGWYEVEAAGRVLGVTS